MAEEVVDLKKLAVLGEDEVGLVMQLVPIDDDNAPAPENVPEISNQGEVVYNADWVHTGILWQHLTGTRNHNPCDHFAPDINPTELQMFRQVFLRGLRIGGVTT